jgi:integrase
MNHRKCLEARGFCGCPDLDEAKRIALDRYDHLKLRTRNKQPAKSIAFATYYERWWGKRVGELAATWKNKGRTGKCARITWYEKQSKRYWLPYFGQHKFEDMTQALVNGYWQWRMAYWANVDKEERRRFGNHALTPSKKTLDMEQSALREVFKWAVAEQLTTFQPIIDHPYTRKGIAAKRRPSFDMDELKTLHTYMDKWVCGKGENDKLPKARINSRHLYQRQLLRLYLQWIEGTGMRTGEVLLLKHADIKAERTELDTRKNPSLRGISSDSFGALNGEFRCTHAAFFR